MIKNQKSELPGKINDLLESSSRYLEKYDVQAQFEQIKKELASSSKPSTESSIHNKLTILYNRIIILLKIERKKELISKALEQFTEPDFITDEIKQIGLNFTNLISRAEADLTSVLLELDDILFELSSFTYLIKNKALLKNELEPMEKYLTAKKNCLNNFNLLTFRTEKILIAIKNLSVFNRNFEKIYNEWIKFEIEELKEEFANNSSRVSEFLNSLPAELKEKLSDVDPDLFFISNIPYESYLLELCKKQKGPDNEFNSFDHTNSVLRSKKAKMQAHKNTFDKKKMDIGNQIESYEDLFSGSKEKKKERV